MVSAAWKDGMMCTIAGRRRCRWRRGDLSFPAGDCSGALVGSSDKSSAVDLAWRRCADWRMARLKPWSRLRRARTRVWYELVRVSYVRYELIQCRTLVRSSQRICSALTQCWRTDAGAYAYLKCKLYAHSITLWRQCCFVQPTKHDLALSWLFRSLQQRDINLPILLILTY